MSCAALPLGQFWQDQGGEVTFISYCESEALKKRLTDENFDFITIDKQNPDPFDLEFTINTLNELSTQHTALGVWLVVDGYHFNAAYQKSVKNAGHKLLCIDDYGHSDHYFADLVLNQNISAAESLYSHREPHTRLLLGTRFALLRREFKQWQNWQREIPTIARKVLITMGGGDPDNVTLKVIRALKQVNMPELEGKIVVGPSNSHLQILTQEISDNKNLEIIQNTSKMPELMAWADIAISAGGSTCWEMAFMGLSSMILVLAENQYEITNGLYRFGCATNLKWHNQVTDSQLTAEIFKLLNSKQLRQNMSQGCLKLVDGKGAIRIIIVMQGGSHGADFNSENILRVKMHEFSKI